MWVYPNLFSIFFYFFFCYSFFKGISIFFFKKKKKKKRKPYLDIGNVLTGVKSQEVRGQTVHIPLDLKRAVWCTVEWTWKCLRNWTKLTSIGVRKEGKVTTRKPIQPVFKVSKRLYVFHHLFSFTRQCFFSLEKDSLSIFESNWFVFIIYRARVEMLFATFIFSPHRQANWFLISSDRSQLPAVDHTTPHTHKRRLCAMLYYQGRFFILFWLWNPNDRWRMNFTRCKQIIKNPIFLALHTAPTPSFAAHRTIIQQMSTMNINESAFIVLV